MRTLYTGNYSLDIPNRTVVLENIQLQAEQVLMITNVTAGAVYYLFTSDNPAQVSIVGDNTHVVFQPYKDCDSHNNSDRLSIYIDDPTKSPATEETLLEISGKTAPFELVGTYIAELGQNSAVIDVEDLQLGSVLLFQPIGPWTVGWDQSWRLESGGFLGGNVWSPGPTPKWYSASTQGIITNTPNGLYDNKSDSYLYRHEIFISKLRLIRHSGYGGIFSFNVYKSNQLDFGTGFPHVISLSSLVYPLDNNLKVSDFQTQTRLGGVDDIAPTSDTPTDKGLIPLFKRLLVRLSVLIGGLGDTSSTAASSDTESTSLISLFKRLLVSKLPTGLGLKAASNSFPVVVATDSHIVSRTQDGSGNDIASGQVGTPVPDTTRGLVVVSNAATQTTLNAVNIKLPVNLGQKTAAGSFPVVLASDQTTLGVSGTVSVSNDFATETTLSSIDTKVATETTLSSIDGKLAALGQKDMAGSIPVVVANNQSEVGVRGYSSVLVTQTGTAPLNSESILPASDKRRYLFLQNLSSAPLYVNFTNPATTSSLRLDAGASLTFEGTFVPQNEVNLLRSTSNQQYYLAYHNAS
jgi:hypothetical protein